MRIKPGVSDGSLPPGGEAWVHHFLYGEPGVIGEIDCRGGRHEFVEARAIDWTAGTALGDHRHAGPARLRGGVRAPMLNPESPIHDPNRLTSAEKN